MMTKLPLMIEEKHILPTKRINQIYFS